MRNHALLLAALCLGAPFADASPTTEMDWLRAKAARRPRERVWIRPATPPPAAPARITPLSQLAASPMTPINVKVNDSSGDTPIATQSEIGLAAWNDLALAAWNDGQGSFTGGAYQGVAYSVDGGATWVDIGDPPKPPGLPQFRWRFDPSVAVNEKTGIFYYCALAQTDATHNAIAVARGSFAGNAFVWQDVQIVREALNTNTLLDKCWIAADSSGAGTSVYVANATFTISGNQIDVYRSTDGGDTWSNGSRLSSPADNGFVHAPRPVVGPDGEVHVIWNVIGQGVPEDFIRVRTSTNHGQSFAGPVTATDYLANPGTGSPGYNRERGIHWPSVAVDRTSGPRRGRMYLAWAEAFNLQDDPLGNGAPRSEVEPNDFLATANPFTPGDVLRGVTAAANPADNDAFSCHLDAGQSLVVWADSLAAGVTYALRVYPTFADTTESLTFGGDLSPGSGVNQAFYAFTAPVSGTYALRMGPYDGASPVGGYRIRAGFGIRAGERGRDQRDVFVASSADGSSWSTPVRVNDQPVGYDDYLPEVAVGADGAVYVQWYDYRSLAVGTRSHQVLSRSIDGGASWSPAGTLSTQATRWSVTGSNLAPNMGDYNRLETGSRWLHAAWADGRDGSADVYTARLDTHPAVACAPNVGAVPSSVVGLDFTVTNGNGMFDNDYSVSLTSTRNWPLPAAVPLSVAAGAAAPVHFDLAVPDTASPGANMLTFAVTLTGGGLVRTCSLEVSVGSAVSATGGPGRFGLGPTNPNPSSGPVAIAFALPEPGPVRLTVHGLDGGLVRSLASGPQAAGAHRVLWDGADERGRQVSAGVYFVRLAGRPGVKVAKLIRVR